VTLFQSSFCEHLIAASDIINLVSSAVWKSKITRVYVEMKKSLKPPDARGGRRIRRGSYFQRISARHGMARRSTTLTFLDTRVPTRMRWNPTVIPRGPCSRKGETGRIVRGRGWSIWTHAPGATRGSRSVITSAPLSLFRIPLDPLDLHRVRTRRTRCTRVLSRVWGRERGGSSLWLNVHAHDRSSASAY